MACPRARDLGEFWVERVGDERVLFDQEANQYHNLSGDAYETWRHLNGTRSVEDVAELVYGDRSADHVVLVQHAIDRLAEDGLLIESEFETPAVLDRRRVTKLAAAAFVGVAGLPVVQSITAPDAASAHSHVPPTIPTGNICPTNGSEVCISRCCCNGGSTYGTCLETCPSPYWCGVYPGP